MNLILPSINFYPEHVHRQSPWPEEPPQHIDSSNQRICLTDGLSNRSIYFRCTRIAPRFRIPSLSLINIHLHWFDWEFEPSRRLVTDSSNFFAWSPGLKTLASPQLEQGSIHQLFLPVHHAPGTTLLRPRLRIFSSIIFSTGSSFWNCRAKAAPLWTVWS